MAKNPFHAYIEQPKPQQAPPADGQSLLSRIAGNVLSPLAMAGNILDLPGSMARDTIMGAATGDWSKHNPFDQIMSPITDANRATGRDVLAQTGLATPNDPNAWEWSDLGGFAAEVALDPLTYVTGGLSGAGKALRGTGGATHLFKVGLPFTKSAVPVGKGAANLLDKAASKAWNTTAGKGLSQFGSGLFDPAVKGMFDAPSQAVARRMTAETASTAGDAAKRALDDVESLRPAYELFDKEFSSVPDADRAKLWNQSLQHAQEDVARNGGDYATAVDSSIQRFLGKSPSPALTGAMSSAVENLGKVRAADRMAVVERGGRMGEVSGKIAHAPRRVSEAYMKSRGEELSGGGLLSTPNMRQRRDVISTIPQADIDMMLAKANRAKYTGKLGALNIRRDFKDYMGYTTAKGKVVNDIAHSNKLKKWLEGVDTSLESIHDLAPDSMHLDYRTGMDKVARNLDAIHGALKDAIDPTGVSIKRAFKAYGMDEAASMDWFSKITGMPIHQVDKLKVNKETAKAIQKVLSASKNPEWLGAIGGMVDKFNKAFKGAVTLPFPSFHMRNFVSGQHMNLASQHIKSPGDYRDYAKAMAEAWNLRKEGAKSNLYREAVANGMAPNKRSLDDTELLGADNPLSPILNPIQSVPAAVRQAGEQVAKTPEGEWLFGADRLLGNRGRQAINTPMQYGSNVARTTEFMNRMPMYLYLKKRGLSPKDAAAEVNKLQFDYSNSLTPFEKNVSRRLVPFYGFTKNIVPQVAGMLLDAPGGKMAQTIRASTSGRGENDVMPAHIANTAAIPLGTKEDGSKSYMTGFGLAPEAAMSYLTAPIDPQGAGLDFLSSMTPLVKGPLEAATGQTFFQRGIEGGRSLNDLDPNLGRALANIGQMTGLRDSTEPVNILGDRKTSRAAEQILANTPASKFLNVARGLTDPRKSILERANNAAFPTRLYDVSPQQQERLLQQASNVLADEMGARSWKNRYFSKEQLEAAKRDNPQLAAQMEQLNALWNQAKRNAKKIKAGETKKARTTDPAMRAEVQQLLRAAGL